MNLEQFEDFLGDFGEQLEGIDRGLIPTVNRIVSELKRDAPTDSGALRDSITGYIVGDDVTFSMNFYGIPQNYGVAGTKSDYGTRPIEDGIEGAGTRMKFASETIGGDLPFGVRKSIAQKGLKPQNWFSMTEITEMILQAIEEQIEE